MKHLNKLLLYTACFLIVPIFFSVLLSRLTFTTDLSNKITDIKYNFFPSQNKISKLVTVVDIDNNSLETLGDSPTFGRWPWKRNVYYPLLNYISSCSPKAVIFDLLFTEKSEYDHDLVEITKIIPNISHAFYLNKTTKALEIKLVSDLSAFAINKGNPLDLDEYPTQGAFPFSELLNNAKHLHGVTFTPDRDGIARSYEIGYFTGDLTLPSLALKAIQIVYPNSEMSLGKQEVSYKLPKKNISLGHKNGRVPIHYYSRKEIENMERVSISDIYYSIYELNSKKKISYDETVAPRSLFQDKIVIIGASASGSHDVHFSPYGELPGTIIQAVEVSNWIEGHFRYDINENFELLFYILLSVFTIYIFHITLSVKYKLSGITLIILLICILHMFLFSLNINFPFYYGIYYFPFYGLFFGIIIPIEERKRRKHATNVMSKYISQEVVDDALSRDDIKAGSGFRREITVMFSDLRNFTVLSEELSPEEVVSILNTYLGNMVRCISANHGTLDKFIGDSVMAFWNAPVVRSNHADLAVQAALDMCYSLRELNLEWKKNNKRTLSMGIGIHTGQAIAGNIGSDERLDYTVIGDTVNQTARLEGLTKVFGSDILLTESTIGQLSFLDKLHYRFLGLVKVKGKKEEISVFEIKIPLEGEDMERFNKTKFIFEKAIQLYFTNQYDSSIELLQQILVDFPSDKAALYYIERARILIDNPSLTHESLK